MSDETRKIENRLASDEAAQAKFQTYFLNVSGRLPSLVQSVDEPIAESETCDVFKGRKTETGDYVIIKVLKLDPKRNRAEIMRKVEFLKSLNYPNYQNYRKYQEYLEKSREYEWLQPEHPLIHSIVSRIPGYDAIADFFKSRKYPDYREYCKYRKYGKYLESYRRREEFPWKHPLIQSLISYVPGSDVIEEAQSESEGAAPKKFTVGTKHAYLIMDYIPGRGLNEVLHESRPNPIPQARVLDWGCEILWALSYMHRYGHIHGKVRLSHIILRDWQISRRGERIALIDYDMLARGGEIEPTDMPNVRNFEKLEKEYPETPEEEKKKSEWLKKGVRRDVYCTGYVMFRLLTGKNAPQSFIDLNLGCAPMSSEQKKAQEEDMAALREGQALSASAGKGLFGKARRSLRSFASDRVNRVILKALAQDGYQTADEMLKALYRLPKLDLGNVLRWAVCFVAASASAVLLWNAMQWKDLGLWQKARLERMDTQAATSVKARDMGDYTSARNFALQAVAQEDGKPSPPETPAAQRALAKASGVYDPTKGYKPQYSAVLRGQLVSAEFSPDGKRIAALVNDTIPRVPEKLLQILDAANGQNLIEPLFLGASASADAKFLNDTRIFCVSATESAVYDLKTGKSVWNVSYPGESAAVSGDGETVAGADWTSRTVRIYDAQTGAVLKELSLPENTPPQKDENSPPQEDESNFSVLTLTGRVLALDRDGQHLAVTVDSGETLFFTRAETEWKSVSLYPLDDIGLNPEFLRVEGGFVGNYFFYCFSASLSSGVTRSVCGRVNAGQPTVLDRRFRRVEHDAMHISVGENGCYLSKKDQLLFMGEGDTVLRALLPTTDGVIRFLRHHDKWILLGTESSFVVLYEDAGSYVVAQLDTWQVNTWEVTRDPEADFQLSAVSADHLLLGGHKSDRLTVLGWREETGELAFSYGKGADGEDPEGHAAVYLCSDGQSAIVARNSGFQIIGGKTDEPVSFSQRPFRLLYLRDPEHPESEVLQAVYYDNSYERFFAKSGEKDDSPSATTQFVTASYRIDQRLGRVEIYDRNDTDASAPLWSDIFKDDLVRASQTGDNLILSMRDDRRQYSLMLNGNFETIAEIGCDCDAMPDGTLIFDAGRGNLRKGKVYTVDEMRTLAERNEGQVMGW
ncbi:MAG: hypothetical protein IJK52_10290 [Oscillospiraceae bacterium]|nr:hypothetical protein [Oscillospiraceae bacterium]